MSAAIDHQDGPVPLPSVIGVNTGTCLVGNIGGRDRFHFNILGDPVNTAARIKGINKVYGTRVLIGESTAKLVADVLLVRPVDWVRMKGKTHPVLVHELLGERAGASAALVAEAGRFGEALRNYRNGAFEEAAKGFGATRWAEPLRSRAAAFAADPPGPDWDGAATMRTK
jgi:adenylate cyclase